jgi:hypothetical protein
VHRSSATAAGSTARLRSIFEGRQSLHCVAQFETTTPGYTFQGRQISSDANSGSEMASPQRMPVSISISTRTV